MNQYLIEHTTREQREQIVKESLGYSDIGCEGCGDGYDMYQPYIDGEKEISEITRAYQAKYVRGDMNRQEREQCNYVEK